MNDPTKKLEDEVLRLRQQVRELKEQGRRGQWMTLAIGLVIIFSSGWSRPERREDVFIHDDGANQTTMLSQGSFRMSGHDGFVTITNDPQPVIEIGEGDAAYSIFIDDGKLVASTPDSKGGWITKTIMEPK
ncbi:MAG: hypothetical protein M3R13_09260 [Armatimonadota bacterium]|nr:hypothetical protein [Armatimonadota bacterium]